MATSGLAVKLEAAYFQLPHDLSVSESGQAAHSPGDHDCVVSPLTGSRQVRNAVAFAPSLNEFSGDVAGDIERLGDGPPLRDEAGKLIRRCEK
jgi:hypothetical protein